MLGGALTSSTRPPPPPAGQPCWRNRRERSWPFIVVLAVIAPRGILLMVYSERFPPFHPPRKHLFVRPGSPPPRAGVSLAVRSPPAVSVGLGEEANAEWEFPAEISHEMPPWEAVHVDAKKTTQTNSPFPSPGKVTAEAGDTDGSSRVTCSLSSLFP